jgi:PAS domain S-box-containing protein
MAVVDLDARPLDTNVALQRLLGYTAEELRAAHHSTVHAPRRHRAATPSCTPSCWAADGDHYQLEKRLLRKDGSVVWCKLTASLVRDSDGRPEYGVGMVEDITERKELEARLLQRHKMEAVGRLGRRHRARLQQPAHRHSRLFRCAHARSRGRGQRPR